MHMYAGTVIAIDRLWHERRRLAVRGRDLVDDVFVNLHVVAAARQRVEPEAKLVLRGGNFVMMLFRLDAHVAHDGQHLAAHVLCGVDGRYGEVAPFYARAVAEIAALV